MMDDRHFSAESEANTRSNLPLGPASKASVTASECAAIRLLADDGYSTRELAGFLGVGATTVHRHAAGKCTWHAPSDGDGRADG